MTRPDCANCPWADPKTKTPRHSPVLGVFPSEPIGVLVGEGPGSEEVDKGTPFVGRTGTWLDERLQENELDRSKLVIINAQACQSVKELKSDDTMRAATKCCAPLFNSQFVAYKHLPILAMGKWGGAAANNGKPITVETGRGFIRGNLLVTWHPTYAAFYNPWKAGEFINDLQRFKRMLTGKLEGPPRIIIKPTIEDINVLVRTPFAKKFGIACDIETRAHHGRPAYEGKDPYRAALRTIAIGIPDLGIAYWWGSNTVVQRAIIRILEDPTILKIFHNGWMFDQPVLTRYGIKVRNAKDTRDGRRAVSATSRLSLRHLTSIYSDFPPWKELEDDK